MPVSDRGPRTVSCGRLVREARLRHGLGQAELARRAGTEQPAISRIERDAVSPTVETLNRLFEAMGETIEITAARLSARPHGGGNQSIGELRADFRDLTVEERLDQAVELTEVARDLAGVAANDG